MGVFLKRSFHWLLIVLILLIAIRAALPWAIQSYVNRELDRAENYDGEIGDVDLHIYRGAYEIEDVRIVKTDRNVPVPFFSAERIDLSVLWSAIFHGALVGEIHMVRPSLNFVDSSDDDSKQTGEGESWQEILERLFPLKIDQFLIEQGEIHFRNFTSEPKVDIYVQNLYARISNFTNSRELSDTLVTTLEATAVPMSEGDLDVRLRFDPYQEDPQFDLNAQLRDLKVSSLNDFIDAYANLDVEAGTLDLAVELAADQGRITGYVKPVINDLKIFKWSEDVVKDDKGLFRVLWEGFAGLVSEVFENQPRDTFATRVPVEGELGQPDTSVLAAVFNILRHAFIEAIQPSVEGSVDLSNVQEGADASESDQGSDEAKGSENENKSESENKEAETEDTARQEENE